MITSTTAFLASPSYSPSSSFPYSFLTESELRQLYRRFGYLSTRRLVSLLERSGYEDHKSTLREIEKYCKFCQKHRRSLGRFKFKLKDEGLQFNHTIIIDVFFLASDLVLHV